MKSAIISGITGQDGAYLASLLLKKGYRVIGLTRSYNQSNNYGLVYLGVQEQVIIEECNLLDIPSIMNLINKYKPCEIYNLAAQSSVKTSFEQPIGTMQFNILSVLNLLESIKISDKNIKLYQASSSEMFGKVQNLPITENTVIHPASPYGISKAAAHWTAVNYRESYNLFVCSGIMFNHESFLRPQNFFIKKAIKESIAIKNGRQEYIRVGNIDIKRDFGYAPAYVEMMWLMLQQDKPDDFLICSGESYSLREILYYIFDELEIDKKRIIVDKSLYRPADIEDMYGDNSKAKKKLGWNYDMNFFQIIDLLLKEEINNYELSVI